MSHADTPPVEHMIQDVSGSAQQPIRFSSDLYEPLGLDEETILQAYFECFTHEPGLTVLRNLYEGVCMVQGGTLLDLGKIQVYQGIVSNIQLYEKLQKEKSRHGR